MGEARHEPVVGEPYYHLKLEDGGTGSVRAYEVVHLPTDVDPMQTAAECTRRGNPRVGMSAKQVVATCWGEPDRVDHRETKRGVSERYIYSTGRYVLLHNGIVTSVQRAAFCAKPGNAIRLTLQKYKGDDHVERIVLARVNGRN